MNAPPAALDEGRFTACVALLGQAGAHQFQLRVSEEPEPTMWIAAAEYRLPKAEPAWRIAAALDPLGAVFGLCELLVDGGVCTHCKKTSAITLDFTPMPIREQVCWYQYDPELATFRRSCE